MSQEYLPLSLKRFGVGAMLRFAKLEVGFHVDLGSLLKLAQVGVGAGVERQNVMPGGLTLLASYMIKKEVK